MFLPALFFRHSYSKQVQKIVVTYNLSEKDKCMLNQNKDIHYLVTHHQLSFADLILPFVNKKGHRQYTLLSIKLIEALKQISDLLDKNKSAQLKLTDCIIRIDSGYAVQVKIINPNKVKQIMNQPSMLKEIKENIRKEMMVKLSSLYNQKFYLRQVRKIATEYHLSQKNKHLLKENKTIRDLVTKNLLSFEDLIYPLNSNRAQYRILPINQISQLKEISDLFFNELKTNGLKLKDFIIHIQIDNNIHPIIIDNTQIQKVINDPSKLKSIQESTIERGKTVLIFQRDVYYNKVQKFSENLSLSEENQHALKSKNAYYLVKHNLLSLKDLIYPLDETQFSALSIQQISKLKEIVALAPNKFKEKKINLADFIIYIKLDNGKCPIIISRTQAKHVINGVSTIKEIREDESKQMEKQLRHLPGIQTNSYKH